MNVRIESVKFDADAKLLDFIKQKVAKLDKFFDAITAVNVVLSLVPGHENKNVAIRVEIPGNDLMVERHCPTFEEAVGLCVDILKENLKKAKEKMRNE